VSTFEPKRAVHRITLPITDRADIGQVVGFRRALHAAPARPHIGNPEREFELWYEIDSRLDEHLYELRVHVAGTGHPITHLGEYVSTMSTANGQLIWHVYVEYPAAS
jgi:hypothetical protein